MPSNDETVIASNVINIIRRIRREGWQQSLHRLGDEEPVLAGYSLSASDKLIDLLQRAGVSESLRRLIEREMMIAQLVCIDATRQANRELWRDFLPGDHNAPNPEENHHHD